jgi:hypothetical protein
LDTLCQWRDTVNLFFCDELFCQGLALHRAGGQAGDGRLCKGSVVTAHQFERP